MDFLIHREIVYWAEPWETSGLLHLDAVCGCLDGNQHNYVFKVWWGSSRYKAAIHKTFVSSFSWCYDRYIKPDGVLELPLFVIHCEGILDALSDPVFWRITTCFKTVGSLSCLVFLKIDLRIMCFWYMIIMFISGLTFFHCKKLLNCYPSLFDLFL